MSYKSHHANIVTYNNVLNPLDRTILTSGHYKNIDDILRELKYDNEIYELVISKNSVIQDGFFEVSGGDIVNIAIVPKGGGGGGKKILGAVAMIALAVVGAGVGAAYGASLVSALFGTATYATAMGTALIAGGITMVGGLLLNAIMPKPNNTLDFNKMDFKNSQTYSWGMATNRAMQSQAIPKVFGTHKITPPLIASYVEAIDDKQYFNGLYALNDGEIKSVSDIKINNEPIQNYKGVSYEVRYAKATQELIKHFNDTHYDKPVNKKLPTDLSYVISQTDGNAVTSLTVTLLMPRGLWYANNDGGLDNYSIEVLLEYSNNTTTWTSFPQSPIRITNNQTSAFRKTLKIANLTPDRYSIRAKFNTNVAVSSRYGSDCVLEYITETISDDFIYPGTALLAVRALATDQLNGNAPTITAVVSANSDNPALVCKQILKDSGVHSSHIMPSFDEWANWCDEKGYKCNIVFDSELSIRKALDTISLLGRANVLQAGSKFDVIIEKAELMPVQSFMFGMGNILSKTFKQTFLPLVDRANFIEITYYDKNKDYEPSVVSISNSPLENNQVLNKTSVTLVGCTDEMQARAYGKFLLNNNRYLTQTIEFEAHIDSLVCRYGDIIKVSHDLPQYGFSGRLSEDSKDGIITLDRKIDFKDFTSYAIQIKNDTNEVKEYQVKEIISPSQIRVNLDNNEYKKFDIYAVGEIDKVTKLYRIIKISTGGEFTRHITAIEYNEDVYNDSELIHSQNISSLGISNLRINESLKLDTNKNIQTYLNLAWRGASLSYQITLKNLQTQKSSTLKTNDSFLDILVYDGATYEITITTDDGKSITKTHKVVGKLAPPPPVSNLNKVEFLDEYELSWSYEDRPIDFKHYEIYKNGILTDTTTNLYTKIKKDEETSYINVIAVDTSNIKSNQASITLKATSPNNVSKFSTIYKDNRLYGYWDSSGKGLNYEIRKGESWELGYKVADTTELIAGLNFNGTYLIKSYYENIYNLKIYSDNAVKLVVDESHLDINVMERISHPVWDGVHNNTQVSNNGLCLVGDYTNTNINQRKLTAHL